MSKSSPNITRVIVAVAGGESDAFWRTLRPLLPVGAHIELLHVVDEAGRRELEAQHFRRPGHGGPRRPDRRPLPPGRVHVPPDQERRLEQAEAAGEEVIVAAAMTALGREARSLVLQGRPEQEIVARARVAGAGLVVVAARPYAAPTPVGPHSIGHAARFVIDHAPCPVLVIRVA
jgi:nucleotide-binding universal stress UspA family protein